MPLYVFIILLSLVPIGTGVYVLLSREAVRYTADTHLPFPLLSFTVDHLSGVFMVLIGLISLAVSIYYIGAHKSLQREHNPVLSGGLFGLFIVTMAGVVSADSVFSFLFLWELMSIVSFFLVINLYESEQVRKAGFTYLIMAQIGAVFIFAALLTLSAYTGDTAFAHLRANASTLPDGVKNVVFVLALIGFGSKSGIVPLHIWMARAYPAAPSPFATMMSAAMVNTGIYGLVRVVFDLIGSPPAWWGITLVIVGVISALTGILRALAESDLRRMLAFSSTENIGIIYVGLGAAALLLAYDQALLASFAMLAAIVHTINHALFKGLLFMGTGAVMQSTRTSHIEALGGLIKTMPWTAACFFIGSAAIAALPPLNGFVGEWMLIQSMLQVMQHLPFTGMQFVIPLAAAALVLTSGLAAICFVKAFGIAFLAKPRTDAARDAVEVGWAMRIGMLMLAVGCIVLGAGAPLLLRFISPAVEQLMSPVYVPETFGFIPIAGLDVQETQLSLSIVLVVLVGLALVLYLLSRFVGKRGQWRRVPAWGCGIDLQPDMAYTGVSLVQPVKRSFVWFYRQEGRWELPLEERLENRIYRPLKRWVIRWSERAKVIQNGNIRLYLLYMFCALILLLLWQGGGSLG